LMSSFLLLLLFLMLLCLAIYPLFPYTTLFRSRIRRLVDRSAHINRHHTSENRSKYDYVCATQIFKEGIECFIQGCRRRIDDIIQDRKSTRLNYSHVSSSYAVFCLNENIIKIQS